ncbi:MAG: Ig-like domain-containing protein [Flavobacteriales bacterium]|jgi:hypothetical protein
MYSLDSRFSLYCRRPLITAVVLIFSVAVLSSCRKEPRDTTPPRISITSPNVNATFYYQNTIEIEAEISDDRNIERVLVEIISPSNVRFLQSTAFYPNTSQTNVRWTAVHDDLFLESGTYLIKITANDGENKAIGFGEIQLVAAPRLLERVCIVSSDNTSSTIDTLNGTMLQPWLNYGHAYRFGGIDARSNLLVISGENPTSLSSYIYPEMTTESSVLPSSAASLTAFHHDRQGQKFYWGDISGNLFVSDRNGSRAFSSIGFGYPLKVIYTSTEHVIAVARSTDNSTSYLNIYPKSSSFPSHSMTIDWEVTGAVPLASNEELIVLSGNENDTGHFAYFNLNTSAINENFSFYDNSVVSALYAGEGNDLYAIQGAGIVRYTNNFSSYSIQTNSHPSKLVYDDLFHTVWTVENDGVHRYNDALTQELLHVPMSNAGDIWLKYNK